MQIIRNVLSSHPLPGLYVDVRVSLSLKTDQSVGNTFFAEQYLGLLKVFAPKLRIGITDYLLSGIPFHLLRAKIACNFIKKRFSKSIVSKNSVLRVHFPFKLSGNTHCLLRKNERER